MAAARVADAPLIVVAEPVERAGDQPGVAGVVEAAYDQVLAEARGGAEPVEPGRATLGGVDRRRGDQADHPVDTGAVVGGDERGERGLGGRAVDALPVLPFDRVERQPEPRREELA